MKKVLIRGPLLSKSGYGEHTRQVFRFALETPGLDVKTEILPWGITPWDINRDSCRGLIGEAIDRSISDDSKFDISFQVQLPNEWDTSRADYNIGVTAGVETDISNPIWSNTHVMKMDKVIVPSQHTKNSLSNSYDPAKSKIEVVPEAFYDELTSEKEEVNFNFKTKVNFLTVGMLTGERPETDRKNLFYLVKWFMEVFDNDPDVGLIIKTSRGRNHAIDKKYTQKLLQKLVQEISPSSFPRIYLLHGDMSRKTMNALYREKSVKAFVSMTRGEGFGLPHLEAAASGLPVIATDWSAHTEFLNLGNWIKVNYELQPVHESRMDNEIFFSGQKWAQPLEKDFKEKISKFRKSHELYLPHAVELSKLIQEKYCWQEIKKRYAEVTSGIF